VQPLYDSTTTRTGHVYYRRQEARSNLRIHFATKKEDEMPEVSYHEELLFDGVWRTHIDYQGRSVKKHQWAPVDDPMDALDLISQNVPFFGFHGLEGLRKTYRIALIPGASEAVSQVHLHLTPDSNDMPDDAYLHIDVWLDRSHWLPTHVEAENQESDIFRLRFPDLRINQPVASEIFDIQIPEGFGSPEVVPLP
jgi:hypothetical protein